MARLHSPLHTSETIAKIKERTKKAMESPEVQRKIEAWLETRAGAEMPLEVRERIRNSIKEKLKEKKVRGAVWARISRAWSGVTGLPGRAGPFLYAAVQRVRSVLSGHRDWGRSSLWRQPTTQTAALTTPTQPSRRRTLRSGEQVARGA
jgi:hypothetical protein